MPVFASDVVACTVSTAVDDDAHDDEDLRGNVSGVPGGGGEFDIQHLQRW